MGYYRWSDGMNYEKRFEATPQTLLREADAALAEAMMATARAYHDGGTHKTRVYQRPLQLHFQYDAKTWFLIGQVRFPHMHLDELAWLAAEERMRRHADNLNAVIEKVVGEIFDKPDKA